MKNRLKQFLEFKNLSVRKFEKVCGVGEGRFAKYFKADNAPSVEVLPKIASNFPELNMDWLITGRGEMLFSELDKSEKQATKTQISVNETLNDSVKILYEERIKAKDAHIRSLEDRITEQSRYIKILIEEHGQELQAILAVTKANEKMLEDGTDYINQHLRPVVPGYKITPKEVTSSASSSNLPED